ncbi:MAG: tRNA lysidine(34) synthetase TilS [Oscillospiraceae bacterium]|jgi:tRNA(Ile)-lysidine synthase|nr:tRNA lysidine(34) synthetase TilS [Oscillospiraceae bacterium]
MNRVADNIIAAINDFRMLPTGRTVVVALSGGADSVCLLLNLLELKERLDIKQVEAVHVNHLLRQESGDDEAFCRELCNRLGVPLSVAVIDVKSLKQKHHSTEETAREARYNCFGQVGGAQTLIATAHNATDNAETVLLSLTRGTSLKGLCGIPPVRGDIIRPLIYATSAEIRDDMNRRGEAYVVDKTNTDVQFSRNRVRLNVLPQLRTLNPSLERGTTKLTKYLREDCDFLDTLALKQVCLLQTSKGIDAARLADCPPSLQRRIIAAFLTDNNITPSGLIIDEVTSLLVTGGKLNPQLDKFIIVRHGELYTENFHQNYKKRD